MNESEMSRQEKTKSGSFLESWFVRGSKKTGVQTRPSSTSMPRPQSETDFQEPEDMMFQMLTQMNDKEIDEKFEVLLNDMNLSEEKKAPLRNYGTENKRKMLIMHYKGVNAESKHKYDKPHQYKEYLTQYIQPEHLSAQKLQQCVDSLRIALTNNTLSWVREFGIEGLKIVFRTLDISCKQATSEKFERVQYECLRCVLKFTNNTECLREFLNQDEGHKIVAKCLDVRKPQVMGQALQILSALCFLQDGNPKIMGMEKCLDAITKVGEDRQRERFKPIIDAIASENKDNIAFGLQFINSMLSQTDDYEFRMHLRNEIMRAGLYDHIEPLKKYSSDKKISVHLEIFNNDKEEDAEELQQRFDNVRLDMDDVNDLFEVLKNTTLETPAEPYFLSILQHLLFVRDDHIVRPAYYKLIEECITQIVLHKSGHDPDFRKRPIDFDSRRLDEIVEELRGKGTSDEDVNRIESLQKQLEAAISAKEEALAKVQMLSDGRQLIVNGPPGGLNPSVLSEIGKVVGGPPPPPMPGGVGGAPPPPPPPPPPMMPGGTGGPPPPPMPGGMGGPPPPPMMPGMGPPPPPMMMMGGAGAPPPPMFVQPDVLPHGLKPKKKWDVTGPLKRANWKTIVPQKMSETSFWIKANEESLASPDILTGLAERFSSKPPSKKVDSVVDSTHVGTLKKVKELKVLDAKAAQNISILLGGSLKHLPYSEVKKCLLRCDDKILSESILEQLIQYLPPADQLTKLQNFKDKYDQLTEAEQFCVTLSEVKRLLPRLKSLSFKHHYLEMVNDVKPDIVSATAACEEVKRSKKFAKILELVLLLGNYMNSGTRNAQAFGFEISFLTKLTGTKDLENKQTLLHYLVETVEKKFPELLSFYDELQHVDKASRVSLDSVQKTLKHMDSSIKNLETDLNNSKVPQSPDDKFSDVMGVFAEEAREQCAVMQNMFKKMDNLFTDLSDFYVFDKVKYTLEEFFTDLKTFKDSFVEAKKDNERERDIIEKNKKAVVAREKAEREKQERAERKRAIIDMNPSETQEGVMDSLLEALQTGSAFSRDQKRKRGPRIAGAERRAQLVRSRSRSGLVGAGIAGRELTSEILA